MSDPQPSTTGILAEYNEVEPRSGSLQAVQAVLNRYILPWLVEVGTPNDYPLPPHRETIPSGMAFERYLKGAHRVPFLYRLAFLKQLSTVGVTTQLDATHTRLSHAIGTAKVATRMLDAILVGGLGERGGLDQLMHDACLFYCFIHDAFHGPLGHSLDLMKDIFRNDLTEKLDDSLLRESLQGIVDRNPDATARQILAAAECCRPGEGLQLIEAVRLLSDPYRLKREAPNNVFLRDIVDSELDADRLDYLMRDALVLEGIDCREFPALVETARAVEEVQKNGEPSLTRLAFARSQERAVAKALGLRRSLYTRYYEAAEKLIVDDMVCHAVYYILREKHLLDKRENPEEERLRQTVLKSILLLTDDDLFAALGELRAEASCYELLIRVRQHNYFVPIHEQGVRLDQVERIVKRHREWMEEVGKLVDKLTRERGKTRYPQASRPEDQQALLQVSKDFLQEKGLLVFAFQEWTKGSFRVRKAFEDRVWTRLCERDSGEKLRQRFAAREYGSVDRYNRAMLDRFPPLHVTTSSFFHVIGKSDLVRHTKEGSKTWERGILFYEQVQPDSLRVERVEVSTEIEERHQGFPLVLSVPATLRDVVGNDLLCKVLFDELESCQWLWGPLKAGEIPSQHA